MSFSIIFLLFVMKTDSIPDEIWERIQTNQFITFAFLFVNKHLRSIAMSRLLANTKIERFNHVKKLSEFLLFERYVFDFMRELHVRLSFEFKVPKLTYSSSFSKPCLQLRLMFILLNYTAARNRLQRFRGVCWLRARIYSI